jgi:hypothetical protein
MPDFRVTWNFVENTGAQFNEVYYVSASNAQAAATTKANLQTNRVSMLHPLNKLVSIRAAQVDKTRVTSINVVNLTGTGPLNFGPVPAGLAGVVSLAGATGGSRKVWMRGLPDAWVSRDKTSGVDVPAAAYLTALQAWFTSLQNNGYGTRQVLQPVPGPLTNLKILQVDGSAKQGYSDVTLSAAAPYGFPARVIIGGASKKDLPSLNGRWSLMQAPAGAIIRIPYQTPEGLVIQGGAAHCRQESYAAIQPFVPANCNFLYFGTRATHVPLTHSRGAKRAARIRASL